MFVDNFPRFLAQFLDVLNADDRLGELRQADGQETEARANVEDFRFRVDIRLCRNGKIVKMLKCFKSHFLNKKFLYLPINSSNLISNANVKEWAPFLVDTVR